MRPFAAVMFGLVMAAPAAARPPEPHVYASVQVLCVGIDDYKTVSRTPGAEKDAQEFGRLAAGSFGYTTDYLLGRKATRAAVEERLADYSKRLGPDDALIVFFAGHGGVINLPAPAVGRIGFLIPYDADLDIKTDTDPAKWRKEAIEMKWLLDQTRAMRAKHVLVIADACCSGFMTQTGARDFADRWDLHNLMTDPSRTVLAAATDAEKAIPDRKGEHGLFTAALLDALRRTAARNEAACVTDVYVPVRERVASASNRSMTPQIGRFGDGNGEFVFIPAALDPKVVQDVVGELRAARRRPPEKLGPFAGMASRALGRANLAVKVEEVIQAFDAPEYRYASDAVPKGQAWAARADRWEKAAALGDPLAMAALHYCFAKGLGREVDAKAALEWARLAYDTGTPAGTHVLGRCLFNAIGGTHRNEREGLRLFGAAAEAGFPISMIQKGVTLLERGEHDAALAAWSEAAKAGVLAGHHYRACYHMKFVSGVGFLPTVKMDLDKALKSALVAANAGYPDSQFLVAKIHGIYAEPPNRKEATDWLVKAARSGNPFAQAYLAQELANATVVQGGLPMKLGLNRSPVLAARWGQLSADQGCAEGHLVLACMYEEGWDTQLPDHKKAIEHCEAAIKGNSPGAMVLMSRWHLDGIVVKKDPEEAVRRARQATAMEDPRGHTWLAALYLDGHVKGEVYRGLYHMTRAADAGHAPAIKSVKELYEDGVKNNFQDGPRKFWTLFKRDYPAEYDEFMRIGRPVMDKK